MVIDFLKTQSLQKVKAKQSTLRLKDVDSERKVCSAYILKLPMFLCCLIHMQGDGAPPPGSLAA